MDLMIFISNVTDDQLKDIIYTFNETKINDWQIEYDSTLKEYHKNNWCAVAFNGSFNTSIVDIHRTVLLLSETYNKAEFIVKECLNTAEADYYMANEDDVDPDYFMRTYTYSNGKYSWKFNMEDHPMARMDKYVIS